MDYLGVRFDLFLFFITFFITFVLYPFWINFVYRLRMGEVSRVHHEKQGVPTMGGFIFVLTVSIVTFIFNRSRTQTLLPLFIACLAGLLGLVEDFVKVYNNSGLPSIFSNIQFRFKYRNSPRIISLIMRPWERFKEAAHTVGSEKGSGLETYHKFIVQGLIGGFMSYWAYFKLGWDYIWMPFLGNIHIGIFYPVFVFLLFIIIINSVSFTDGLDGLAGGLAFFSFVTFWAISRVLGYNSLAGFCATFVGALLPFLY